MVLKFLINPCYLIMFITSFCVQSLSEPIEIFSSCLDQNQVKNYTLFANSDNENSDYYKLLNFSIQNLRFAEPVFSKPTAIVLPHSKEQLISTFLCSKQGSLEIRIRCGGHNYEGFSSVSSNEALFLIIDLMNLNQVWVDLESETAWVEGGATLGELYHSISESSEVHGFSAGSCPTVGSGGHISGGGFGFLSRKYGLAADNVVDVLLLDANGKLLDREAMGEEVFWAIRGGGGGLWGIVYAWRIKLVQVPKTVTSFIVSRPETEHNVAELVHKWQLVAPKLEDDFYLSAFIGSGLPETQTVGMSAIFKGLYLGSIGGVMSILNQNFPELGIVEEDCIEMSWIKSVLYFSGLNQGSSTISDLKNRYLYDKRYFKAKSDYVKVPISVEGIRASLRVLEREPRGYVILDPYGGIMNRISNNSISFPHREGNLYAIQYLVSWKKEENHRSHEFIGWIRSFYSFMTPFVSMDPRSAYVNYLDLDLGVMNLFNGNVLIMSTDYGHTVEAARAWGEKYFMQNYNRLVLAKTIIDPNNVFYNQQGIPPMSKNSFKSEMLVKGIWK